MRIALYVIWALFFTAVAITLVHTVRKTRAQERLIASWPKAVAAVTGSRQGWTHGGGNMNRNIRYWPRFQFHDSRGVRYVGESEVSYANAPAPGSPLEVAYNPQDPTQSFQVAAPSKIVLGCLVPTFVLLGLVAFWFIQMLPLD
ncbi:DUF3592 domain-containing protein [Tessaracoccus sp. SD287]|uniref:DUF3592 domain-containing protein n=1 Tax=Tessaracoccus sp. SD287 TaxID=2782008 RepID=UPI001A96B1CD|nr:DUF3592 domain-containing protein [Tessaracoccus sp. SD287]MBO1031157.1 DUF3592 domain-containing protein [Tessaracoccus sp. SD287]